MSLSWDEMQYLLNLGENDNNQYEEWDEEDPPIDILEGEEDDERLCNCAR